MTDVLSWMDGRLTAAGIARTGPVVEHRVRAWGTVLTAPTDRGPVWFKAPGPRTVFEVRLYEVLAAVVPDRVLTPIATDPERGWLLLPDGGPTLDGDLTVLAEVLPRYGALQRDLASHVDSMLAVGVTDMRPAAMPARFDEAVEVARSRAESPDDHAAIDEVVASRPEFVSWCDRLAASPVPSSLDHNDLHPANVFADGTRFYDWGDAVVAHPFASMLVALGVPRLVHDLDDAAVHRLRDAYLEPFTDLAPRAELVAEVELACRVAKPARTLVWDRALAAGDGGFRRAPLDTLLALREPDWLALR
ncbi:aminoglycoside phosphotransferase family protein [Actinophytocola gossypii]|uniref:Phosphotransferase n=1 Tax=Actinophytocola gossypii TaxID=2812003 RepID=A0ABT2J4T5_9PSEU|nr:aminoglycoside phosphotransferase family protein [Actinophytocola gossypii]MCT2582876.1 phosphotransferase [Actinophytocola gossypii]